MEKEEIVARLREKKLLIAVDALEHLGREHQPDLEEILVELAEKKRGPLVTREWVDEVVEGIAAKQKAKSIVVYQETRFRPLAAETGSQLRFHDEQDVTGKSTCTGKAEDFVALFRDRLAKETRLLKARPSDTGISTLGGLKQAMQRKNTRIVGMVFDKRVTKNGHTIIELEDEETSQACLVPKDAQLALKEAAADVVKDEVIALDGYLSNGLFIVKEIVCPDIPIRENKLVEDDVCIAFLSDLQLGSKYFMQEQFNRFLRFLHGEGETTGERELAGKIKYVLVAGDVVDGIGVYPEQEKELVTKDVYTQYEIFAELMKSIPEYVEVVVGPGNHDAVRIAQPRPRLPDEFGREIRGYKNIHFVGDPAFFEAHGLKTLMFHGDSFFSMAASMPKLNGSYVTPEKAAVEMLRKRHLSPVYGENPIVPEHNDFLFINEAPDVLHFGHVHHNGYANYRGTTIVNSGTWQATTSYQLKQGHVPTPCLLPVYHCRTAAVQVLNFAAETR